MIAFDDSITMLASPGDIWKVVVDVPRWWPHFYLPSAKNKDYGWSEDLRFLGGEGPGMRWGAGRGGTVMQTMRVEQWSPLETLVLASEPWNPDRASVMVMKMEGKPGHGFLKDFFTTMTAVAWRISLTLAPAGPEQTTLTLSGEFRPLSPLMEPFFQIWAWPGIKRGARRLIAKFPDLL